VALKEDLAAPPESEVMAQITFQRFFRRYWRLAGVSGTLREARGELHAVYGAAYVAIAPHAPSRRIALPPRRYADRAALDRALVERVQALHRAGRPVLIGTDGVDDSARVAEVLRACGLAPAVLDALHATEEALVVGRAGACGRVTVATRMAGRGTDIALDPAARAAGGLHVLCLQRNPSRRLDRQLAGRAARGGDPGSVETWWCDADESDDASRARERPLAARLAHFAWRLGQAREERRRAALRRELLRQDLDWNQRLSFTGRAT
jgi:preprotein translocase subunit SecA